MKTPPTFRNILSPIDLEDESLDALDQAAALARQSDGIVHLLHVVPSDEIHLHRSVYRPEEGGGANEEWAQSVARERLEKIARERLQNGLRYEVLTCIGDPAEGILKYEHSLPADLVVLSTHGRTGIAHLVLGSVAEKVVRESECPVLTLRR